MWFFKQRCGQQSTAERPSRSAPRAAAKLRKQQSYEIIDEVYSDVRKAVDNQISSVEGQFNVAAKLGSSAQELELISMLHKASE